MTTSYIETSLTPDPPPFAGGYPLRRRLVKNDTSLFRPSRVIPALFVLLACMVPSVPDVWTRGRQLGPLGLDGSMWSAISIFCVASVSIQLRQSWVAVVSSIGLCAMIVLGLVESHVLDVDLIVGDIFVFAAVPVGAAWAFTITESERRIFLRVFYCANWVMLAGINFLLAHQTIQRSQPGPRVFVYSEFHCTWALAILTPFIYFDKGLWSGRKKIIAQIALVSTTLLMAWTASVSITRSVFIQLVLCLAFTAAGVIKFRRLSVRWLLVALAAVTAFFGFLVAVQSNKSLSFEHATSNQLEQRLLSTGVAREERIPELRELLSQYGGDLFVGRGLGSGFSSVIFSNQEKNFAPAPHIAVLTLLMKGGVLAFVVGIVLPAVLAISIIIGTREPQIYCSCAGVLMYIAFSSVSGGWTFPQLFGYGFVLSQMLSLTERTCGARRYVPVPGERPAANYSERQVRQTS